MFDTVYVIEGDAAERRWLESALAGTARRLVFLDGAAALQGRLPAAAGDCLLCSTEPDADAALELVRALRARGEALPVVMTGPYSAFRTAVDLARLAVTDFVETPLSAQRLRQALQRVVRPAGQAEAGGIEP
jgi:DNA-binding NtrC family response regulator